VPAGVANYIQFDKNNFVAEAAVELSVKRSTANAALLDEIR
jgi:hypothetical protein